jgi:multiple sugar transport system permease protein
MVFWAVRNRPDEEMGESKAERMPRQVERSLGRPNAGRRQSRLGEIGLAYVYLAPAVALLIAFTLGPFVYVFYASVLHDPGSPTQSFVGLDNYRYLLDPALQSGFVDSLITTFYYVVGVVPAGIALSLLCALLLRVRLRGWSIFRLLFFLPFVTPAVPTSIIWLWIVNPQFGLLNYLLGLLHLPALGWIDDPHWAMPSVIIYSLWQYAGFNTIVFLAGLTTIPRELEEAARVDGASALQVVRHITLPLLTPTIFFVFVVAVIESLKVFTPIYALTGGGPAGATTTVGFFLYQDAFVYFHLDTASAVAVILFIITMIFTIAQTRASRKWVFYK